MCHIWLANLVEVASYVPYRNLSNDQHDNAVPAAAFALSARIEVTGFCHF